MGTANYSLALLRSSSSHGAVSALKTPCISCALRDTKHRRLAVHSARIFARHCSREAQRAIAYCVQQRISVGRDLTVAIFTPRQCRHRVAALFPKPWPILGEDFEPRDPLRAFPS